MFEDSDLLQRDTLVLRATSPPAVQFPVLDETGVEIGRLVEDSLDGQAWLVLYDREKTRVLAVEKGVASTTRTRSGRCKISRA